MKIFKISKLTQGMFVGSVSDNFDERIEQKIFHCEIVVDNETVAKETKAYQKILEFTNFVNEAGENMMQQEIEQNYYRIKEEVQQVVDSELVKLKDDLKFKDLIK